MNCRHSLHTARRPDLDGLRGVAVLLVIFLHYVVRGGFFLSAPWPLNLVLNSFWSGVDIFFVLSGFLIGGIILDHGHAGNFFGVFYLRRTLRIVPLAFLVIALSYLLVPLVVSTDLHGAHVPPYSYFLFINNYWTAAGFVGYTPLGPFWSLAVEEQFYLAAPILILWSSPRARNVALILVVLASPVLRAISTKFSPWDFTPLRLDGFCMGILAATLVRSTRLSQRLFQGRRVLFLLVCFAVGLSIILYTSPQLDEDRVAYGVSLNSFVAASVILFLHLSPGSWLSKGLSMPWLTTIGRLSYSLYLVHIPVLTCLKAVAGPRLHQLTPLVAFAVSLAWAALTWRLLEAPLLAFGRRVRYRTPPARIESPAPAET